MARRSFVKVVVVCACVVAGCSRNSGAKQTTFEKAAADAPAGLPCDDWNPKTDTGNPPTAGNRVSSFLSHVQEGRDPTITGGVDDPFGCAYEELCSSVRDRVSEPTFRSTRAEAVSVMMSADTWACARSGDFERVGVDVKHDDTDTLDPDLVTTWHDVDVTWYEHVDEHTVVSGAGRSERWRIELVRETGQWHVCGMSRTPRP